jgi:mRNA interferase RelE/StbE
VQYTVEFLPAAERDLRKLVLRIGKAQARVVRDAILELAKSPRPPNAKVLQGFKGILRVRSGNYRIVYRIEDRRLVVLVVAIGDRGDVYQRLRNRLGR